MHQSVTETGCGMHTAYLPRYIVYVDYMLVVHYIVCGYCITYYSMLTIIPTET